MIELSEVPTSKLLEVYNVCTARLGGKEISKFEDRAAAERRTKFLLSQIAPEKRPEPFREGESSPTSSQPELPAGEDAAEAGLDYNTITEEGEEPHVGATEDADPGEARPEKAENDKSRLNWGERSTKRRQALLDKLEAHRGDYVTVGDLVHAVYGPTADVKATKGPLLMAMKGIYRLISDNDLPVELLKQKVNGETRYGLIDKA